MYLATVQTVGTAFTIGGWSIQWYGIIIAAALLAGIGITMAMFKRKGMDPDSVLDLALIVVPLAIIGARVHYVLWSWQEFAGRPFWHVFAIWEGGMAIFGSILAGMLGLLIYARWRKVPFYTLCDCLVPALALGQAIGRWGNFMNREAFGAATELPWRMRLWTSATTYMDVHPTFLYESLWNVIGLLLLYFVVSRARRFDGENTCFYFIWYGLGRFWIEGLRTDSLYLFNWTLFGQRIRVSQALSLVMVLVWAGILVYQFKVKKADGSNLFVKRVQQTTETEEAATEPTAPDEKQ